MSAAIPTTFSRDELRSLGFSGWIAFSDVRSASIPDAGGVYVVVFPDQASGSFADKSCGGWFKGRDPTVPATALHANWVDGAHIAYIGKATSLRTRLRQYADFGAGKPVGHWGGRLIWQLGDPTSLQVAWLETPAQSPLAVEAAMIAAFQDTYGKPPFANNPQMLGR